MSSGRRIEILRQSGADEPRVSCRRWTGNAPARFADRQIAPLRPAEIADWRSAEVLAGRRRSAQSRCKAVRFINSGGVARRLLAGTRGDLAVVSTDGGQGVGGMS